MTVAYVLDDDPQVRAMVFHVLASAGYQAQVFSDSEPMLAKLESTPRRSSFSTSHSANPTPSKSSANLRRWNTAEKCC